MNNERRKVIEAQKAQVETLLESLKDLGKQASDIKLELESARDEEQDYYDNMPESLQGGDKGERAQAAVSALEDAIGSLEEIEDLNFDDLLEQLDTAAE